MLLNFRLIFGIEAMNRPSCCDLIHEVVFSGEHLNLADKKKNNNNSPTETLFMRNEAIQSYYVRSYFLKLHLFLPFRVKLSQPAGLLSGFKVAEKKSAIVGNS